MSQQIKKGSTECNDCRYYFPYAHRDLPPNEIKAKKDAQIEANQNEEKREAWLNGPFANYLKRKADSAGGRAPKRPRAKQTVVATKGKSTQQTIIGSICWPPSVYADTFNIEPTPGMIKPQTFADGTVRRGILREDDGTPLRSGCIRMDTVMHAGVKEETELASTDTAVRDEEVGDMAMSAFARVPEASSLEATVKKGKDGMEVQMKTDKDVEEAVKAKAKAAAKRKGQKTLGRNDSNQSRSSYASAVDFLSTAMDWAQTESTPTKAGKLPRATPKVPQHLQAQETNARLSTTLDRDGEMSSRGSVHGIRRNSGFSKLSRICPP